ncbi:hypothetical protein AVEN_37970-1 [Araneus ventricosus]|uniref:Integrase catalytic domain-containing protein n=1 Tax=Araneus ventricosus TaxID=182803 RepID=A0A4Y2TTA9_ARAVE|nr:hypothetical protein AVEN_37970-1 [Araneus ventricosus]
MFPNNDPSFGSPLLLGERSSYNDAEKCVLLSTATLLISNSEGENLPVKAILDSGPFCNLISENLVGLLGVERQKTDTVISCLNGASVRVKTQLKTDISNRNEYFCEFLRPGQCRVSNSQLILQNSVFGFLASGRLNVTGNQSSRVIQCKLIANLEDLHKDMTKFWELEKIEEPIKIVEEEKCEKHFLKTYSRNSEGQYVVELPLNTDPDCLGETKTSALGSLNSLWRRLSKNPELLSLYRDFMQEYEALGHMELVTDNNEPSTSYYLPHHGVFKPDKTSTKLRVMFNASALSSNGLSLNDIQMNGGLTQEDLFSIMLCFRKHKNALCEFPEKLEVHGFADASEKAYGAVVYLKSSAGERNCVHLLCRKSRVAPLKSFSVPKLELCAAVLLAQLVKRVLCAIKLEINDIYLWSDSTIVLAWIQHEPWELKIFVANRISAIQELTKKKQWFHVSSGNNPADVLSRGLAPEKLCSNELWWTGPSFLQADFAVPMSTPNSNDDVYLSELKTSKPIFLTLNAKEKELFIECLLSVANSYLKLIRVMNFIFRFIFNSRNPHSLRSGPLTGDELKVASEYLIKEVQVREFSKEISALRKGNSIPKGSNLRNLNPSIDSNGILRIGGRLEYSNLTDNQKHPIILPESHRLTKLIFVYFHLKNLHVGPQGLLCAVLQKFWPIHGRNLSRKIVNDCITCFRNKPVVANQIMGNLPAERITPTFPFNLCGVDFIGPLLVKPVAQRRITARKMYVAIFVCFVTKAVHFELVADLTSEAFIACLKRFFARRGKSSIVSSDNATNFVGAQSELKRLSDMLKKPDENVSAYLASEEIKWKFSPPRSPNFGGLYEAGVKSFKYHFRRVMKNTKVSIEEIFTIISQIEGILNSRPLTPLSCDPTDLSVLTAGHFLVGRPIMSVVEPEITETPDNRLSRWQRTTKVVQFIWKRWHRDYLNHLQQRSKWQFEKNDLKIGSLVLLKEYNIPPCKWVIGRVKDVIPGSDGKIRVANVQTQSGLYRRGISKICVLPMNNNE